MWPAKSPKFGWVPDDVPAEAERLVGLPGVRVRGVMVMAPLDAAEGVLRVYIYAGRRAPVDVLRAAGIRRRSCRWGCRTTTKSRSRRVPRWCGSAHCSSGGAPSRSGTRS